MMNMMSFGRKDEERVRVAHWKPTLVLADNEDLTLFKDLHTGCNITSLLHPLSHEFDSSISVPHLHPYGNYQLYRLSSGKKGSSGFDFLTENDKHDYDWLKTPPATPLFPSIELEANAPQLAIQNRTEIALLQPLSRNIQFADAGGNNNNKSSDGANSRRSKANGSTITTIQKPIPKRSPSPSAGKVISTSTANNKNKVIYTNKTSSSVTGSQNINYHSDHELQALIPSRPAANQYSNCVKNISRSKATMGGGRAISPLVRSVAAINKIDGFSNERPHNLRTQQRLSSATRGAKPQPSISLTTTKTTMQRRQSCSPSVSRCCKADDQLTTTAASVNNNKLQAPGSSVVLGSKMVEMVVNTRKSASNIKTTITTTKSNCSRSKNFLTRSPK